MIDEIKIMLGDRASNYPDELIELYLKQSLAEVEAYTRRELDYELEILAQRITILKLNRHGTEGLASESYSGVSFGYVDGYPADLIRALNRKRKIRVM